MNDVNYSDNTRTTGPTQQHADIVKIREMTTIRSSFGVLFAINIMVVGF